MILPERWAAVSVFFVLAAILKTSQESRALFLIYASSTGDAQLMEKLKHLGHTNFWTRYAAAVYLEDFELQRTSDPRDFSNAIPVCVEAITNAPALARMFGINGTNLQNRAAGLLRKISPETAAKYHGSGQ